MLLKLSFSSMRKSFKDYLVLLFGLTISIAIFYMFQTLAQNKAFIESNAMISQIVFIFHVGSFILGAITVFYIFYATSFMLTLRQKEMGMYMTLGAKKGKITQLMFFETFFIGIISLVIGIVIGIGLAMGVAELFMWQLNFSGEGFEAFYISSLTTTVIFYIALFVLTSIVNAWQIGRKSVLNLLRADQKQDQIKTNGLKTFFGVFFALILIGVGYYAMMNMAEFKQFGVILATVTIIPGTYLIFISLLPYFIKKLKQNRSLNEKGINSFTLGQLRFRMLNLTKVLGTVAMLIALGLGAMTAGISFYHNIEIQSSMFHANDVVVHQPDNEDKEILEAIDFTEENVYHYKADGKSVYFLKEDLLNNPPGIKKFTDQFELPKTVRVDKALPDEKYSLYESENASGLPEDWQQALSTELNASYQMFGDKDIFIYSTTAYDKIPTDELQVTLGKVDDFTNYLPHLEKLNEGQLQLAESYRGENVEVVGGKYSNYIAFQAIASGTIFMGLFLGIAFLMMMASVLMFKLLSSAGSDVSRYNMLRKIGVRKGLLVKSIYRELFLLFLFPALVGLVHVLVGMQMFSFIIIEPYAKIWIPISIFLLIYGIYYWITVQMYKRIVLPKEI
ncbi:ABC transporter permease [Virgibacillus profundi]|uniref:ABC transporter permease n=1 Tax=Virgibacillus profundi TaxID=2024555 RepID=A0A2A2IIX2_9BACI|nr:FtsX-like permease family protein [Virgibacillus profundi]PAV31482.1 ABC transporter permease [Virgibacillus profundi]PXY55668.1 ABC transporter permease [Virgibacillus profundi]